MLTKWNRYGIIAFLLPVAIAGAAARADDTLGPQSQNEKRALLVGCTQYPNHKDLRQLNGPVNDAVLWRQLLTGRFGFAPEKITVLAGWPKDNPTERPTRANIVKAFEGLIAAAHPGMSIFIQISGHGMQVPIPEAQDPLDPKNPEPDGLDEVFLAADVEPDDLTNALRDDEFGGWLDRIRAKGASVWIVFDCCHSGTMTRGTADRGEVSRVVDPADFGIPAERIANASRRAAQAVRREEARGAQPRDLEGSEIRPSEAGRGSLIAFFAAQPFEEAPELPQPEDAPHTPENYYGLLSYSLVKSLEARESPISYQELHRQVLARYRAERGTGRPTPSALGDLNREVFGALVWPARQSITINREANGWALSAGSLRGLTPGSILVVRPATAPAGKGHAVLGYVKVESATPSRAQVVPCGAPEGMPAPPKNADWKDSDVCELVRQELGEMRVRLFIPDSAKVKAAWEQTPREVREMTRIVSDVSDAQWLLAAVTPEQAERDYGMKNLRRDYAFLVQGRGAVRSAPGNDATAPPRVFAALPLDDAEALAAGLTRDLPRIFKWQNVWRIAGDSTSTRREADLGLVFEMALLKSEDDRSGGEPLRTPVLRDKQVVEFRLRNEGYDDLWVTMLYLDADVGIETEFEGSLGRGKSLAPVRFRMSTKGGSIGPEGMVVFAVPIKNQKEQPSYAFLEQEPLKVIPKGGVARGNAPNTPFGRLLEAAAFNAPTRGRDRLETTTPAVLTYTWTLLDKAD